MRPVLASQTIFFELKMSILLNMINLLTYILYTGNYMELCISCDSILYSWQFLHAILNGNQFLFL